MQQCPALPAWLRNERPRDVVVLYPMLRSSGWGGPPRGRGSPWGPPPPRGAAWGGASPPPPRGGGGGEARWVVRGLGELEVGGRVLHLSVGRRCRMIRVWRSRAFFLEGQRCGPALVLQRDGAGRGRLPSRLRPLCLAPPAGVGRGKPGGGVGRRRLVGPCLRLGVGGHRLAHQAAVGRCQVAGCLPASARLVRVHHALHPPGPVGEPRDDGRTGGPARGRDRAAGHPSHPRPGALLSAGGGRRPG